MCSLNLRVTLNFKVFFLCTEESRHNLAKVKQLLKNPQLSQITQEEVIWWQTIADGSM